MAGKRTSRKRRKQRRAASAPPPRPPAADVPSPEPRAGASEAASEPSAAASEAASLPRGYARSRARDEAIRAGLRPLRPGERPTAVTVGAIVATVLAVANLVALAFGYNAGEDTLS